MLTNHEQNRLALLVPKLSNAKMHRYLPIRTYRADPAMISPEQVSANMVEVAIPYLAAFEWHSNIVASNTRMGALKILSKLSSHQRAMIYAGYMFTFETAFPAPPPGELYERNAALKDHVKSLNDLAAGTPFPAGRYLTNADGEFYVE